jgi:hypothetical protein
MFCFWQPSDRSKGRDEVPIILVRSNVAGASNRVIRHRSDDVVIPFRLSPRGHFVSRPFDYGRDRQLRRFRLARAQHPSASPVIWKSLLKGGE